MRRWLEGVTTDWHEKAACVSRDPFVWSLFDPLGDKEPVQFFYERAERAIDEYCVNCPVMMQCAAERDRHSYQGVWGGEASEKRGIVDVQTGLLVRKHVHDTPAEAEADSAVEDLADVVEIEPEIVHTKTGTDQYALALAT